MRILFLMKESWKKTRSDEFNMIRKLIGIEIIFHAKSVGALILRFSKGKEKIFSLDYFEKIIRNDEFNT